jgi:hypothetical protein
MTVMHTHHYFHANQVYLSLETLLKSKNSLQNIELPRSTYPNFSDFVDSTVFNKKSNNSLSISWNLDSVSAVVRRQEISKHLGNNDKIEDFDSLYQLFSRYLTSLKDLKIENIDKLPMTIILKNSSDQTKRLQNILKQYITLFVNDDLCGTGKDVSFEAHMDIFREYLNKVLKVYNPKYFLISNQELAGLLKEKYGFINETITDYKFIEMVSLLWFSEVIRIYDLTINYENNKYNYTVTVALNKDLLTNEYIKEKLNIHSVSSFESMPMNRSFNYENSQLRFRLSDGSTDQFDFSKAIKSRIIFETFWELWKKDNSGEYSIKQVAESYKLVTSNIKVDSDLLSRIGEIVSNVRSTIIEPKDKIKDNIEWHFERKRGIWIFRILNKVNN